MSWASLLGSALAVVSVVLAIMLSQPWFFALAVLGAALAFVGLVQHVETLLQRQMRLEQASLAREKNAAEARQQIANIAGSVGRSAPLIREVHQSTTALPLMVEGLSVAGPLRELQDHVEGPLRELQDQVAASNEVIQEMGMATQLTMRKLREDLSANSEAVQAMGQAIARTATLDSTQEPSAKSKETAGAPAPTGHLPAPVEMESRTGRHPADLVTSSVQASVLLDPSCTEEEPVVIPQAGVVVDCEINEAVDVVFHTAITYAGEDPAKAAVLWARVFDADGRELDHAVLKSHSERFGSFQYLAAREGQPQAVRLSVPSDAARICVGLVPWHGEVTAYNRARFVITREKRGWRNGRSMRDVRVAMILDEFSYNSFRPECTPVVLTPQNWREQMDTHRPDVFFCESAWSGVDSDQREWKGMVYTSTNFARDPRGTLFEILAYCKQHRIPTVFWNKEDPSHFDDKVHNFVDTAIRFDHIFTTDSRSVDRYRHEYGHKSVHCLPFAVQPRLFNPIEMSPRSEAVVFAGAWYENHRKRSADMAAMFDAVLSSGRQLKIYDRFYGQSDNLHHFPEKYQDFLNPPVGHAELAAVYKESVIGMTINTEQLSPTMFARRIFELMCCNTFVVSNRSAGVEAFFGDTVPFLDEDPDALKRLDQTQIDEIRERNLELVLSRHTYRHRMETILDVAGVDYRKQSELTTALARIDAVEQAEEAVRGLRAMDVNRRVLLVSAAVAPTDSARLLSRYNGRGVVVADERLLASGATDVEELTDGGQHVYLLALGQPVDGAVLDRLRMHAVYVDLPVRMGSPQERYRVTRAPLSSGILVPALRLTKVLEEMSRGAQSLVYTV